MAYPHSDYLSQAALRGLNKLGDVVLPGNPYDANGFPTFSDTGCIHHIDELMATTAEDDVKALNILLMVLSVLPSFCIRWLIQLTTFDKYAPGVLGMGLRMGNVALRGVPISLYYSNLTGPDYDGVKVHDVMGYEVHCEPDY